MKHSFTIERFHCPDITWDTAGNFGRTSLGGLASIIQIAVESKLPSNPACNANIVPQGSTSRIVIAILTVIIPVEC
jgi:hypothetical protein